MCDCGGGVKRTEHEHRTVISSYSVTEGRSPHRTPHMMEIIIGVRSDAAAAAGGIAAGSTMGHLAGEAITRLFTGPRRQEVMTHLPQNYQMGQEPSGPCAYEISQFLQCAASNENLQECEEFNAALRDCKRRNRIP